MAVSNYLKRKGQGQVKGNDNDEAINNDICCSNINNWEMLRALKIQEGGILYEREDSLEQE